MKITLSFTLCIVFLVVLYNDFSFGQFVENFEYYFPDQQVACQKPQYWTTFNLVPCDPVEDAYVSTEHAYHGSYALKIVQNNDLVKPYDEELIAGIDLMVYIPSGKSGYFNILSGFSPNPNQWAMECYFDSGGTGRILHGNIDNFNWTPDTWHSVSLYLDIVSGDQAYFYFDYNLISNWQWSQGGQIDQQVEAVDFYGATANDEMYVDDFTIWDGCLSCGPPNPSYNLTAEEIFNLNPAVRLTWQFSGIWVNGYYIVRKNGYPNDPGNYEYIGATRYDTTEYIDSLVIVNERYSYGVVTYGRYGYSDTSNIVTILVEPTPVELVSFSGSVNSNNEAVLSWLTSTETNNSGFDIERCQSSEIRGKTGWGKIGFIKGNGTTTENHSYSFTDKNVTSGKYFYRLKQIDFDGSCNYSKIVEVELTAPNKFSLEQNYPNPFNPTTTIGFSVKDKSNVKITILNVIGEEVAVLLNEEKEQGYHKIEFNAANLPDGKADLPSGVYFYQLKAGDFIQTKKMILLK